MRATMAENRAGVTVQTLNPAPSRGPVFFASLPGDNETCKELLVATLWDHLQATATPLWKQWRLSSRADCRMHLVYGPLGRPQLQLGGFPGPAISFSRGGGKLWAALSGDESDVGIDVAESAEFRGAYPFQRLFHPEELHHALKLTDGDLEAAAALLWSVKEAVVKALGCGFHLVEPRQITVHRTAGESGGHTFPVVLSGKASMRFPLAAGPAIQVHSLPREKMWLSIALFKKDRK